MKEPPRHIDYLGRVVMCTGSPKNFQHIHEALRLFFGPQFACRHDVYANDLGDRFGILNLS